MVLGRSLGGAVAIYSCSRPENLGRVKGLIVENTFTSIHDVGVALFGNSIVKHGASLFLYLLLTHKWESYK